MVFVTTVPESFIFFKGQLSYLSEYFDICAISSQVNELDKVGQSENIKTVGIPMKRPVAPLHDIFLLLRFIRVFKKLKPDIVHGNTPKGSFLSLIAAYLTGVPVRIYMCHGLRYQGTSGIFRKVLMSMERVSCKCATTVLCVSEGVRKTLVEDRITDKAKVVLHGSSNGLDFNFFDKKHYSEYSLRQQYNLSDHDFVFIFVGRIVKEKGVDELLYAFDKMSRKYPDIKLFFVGEAEKQDPISPASEIIIKENKSIHYFGLQKDIRPYLALSDTLVLPTYREGFGMVLLEAAAMGVPTIASDIIGCNNVVIEGENGLLVKPKDKESLLEKMELMYNNEQLRHTLKNNTRESACRRFEQKMVWNALLEEYTGNDPSGRQK
ncbi:MAG: glycosyltransferase family 4 protein [Tannerella sp.]|nr:glycosyltransferase family 4 protein [Tannerella sp.]